MTRKAKYWLIGVCAAAGFLIVMLVLTIRGGGVPDGSVLVLNLHGPIGEQRATSAIERILEGRGDTILGLRALLHGAAEDGRISALLVKVGGLQIGMAKADDLRDQILHFRKTGKPVVALMEMGSTLDYYVIALYTYADSAEDIGVPGLPLPYEVLDDELMPLSPNRHGEVDEDDL